MFIRPVLAFADCCASESTDLRKEELEPPLPLDRQELLRCASPTGTTFSVIAFNADVTCARRSISTSTVLLSDKEMRSECRSLPLLVAPGRGDPLSSGVTNCAFAKGRRFVGVTGPWTTSSTRI